MHEIALRLLWSRFEVEERSGEVRVDGSALDVSRFWECEVEKHT